MWLYLFWIVQRVLSYDIETLVSLKGFPPFGWVRGCSSVVERVTVTQKRKYGPLMVCLVHHKVVGSKPSFLSAM